MNKQKALFLDRDGVINEEVNYLHKIKDFRFIDEIFQVCNFYISLGYIIIVITNQAGIARGYYTEEQYQQLTLWMLSQFQNKEISISKVYHCPHHPDFSGICDCRKPKPGMLLKAIDEFNIDTEKSLLIGDKLSDLEAGLNAGIEHVYHIEEIIESIKNLPLP